MKLQYSTCCGKLAVGCVLSLRMKSKRHAAEALHI